MAQQEIVTKARIELIGGASHTDRRGQIFRGKPFTTTDRAEIEHYMGKRPMFTVTPLASAPPIVAKSEQSHTHEAAPKPDLFERLVGKAPEPAKKPAISEAPAPKDSKPEPLPWSPKSNLAELLAACRSRDILASDKDTRNKLLAILQDHDNPKAKVEASEDEPKAEEKPAQGEG